eukprot:13783700-Alexandrium_andersonii.AAC.1
MLKWYGELNTFSLERVPASGYDRSHHVMEIQVGKRVAWHGALGKYRGLRQALDGKPSVGECAGHES